MEAIEDEILVTTYTYHENILAVKDVPIYEEIIWIKTKLIDTSKNSVFLSTKFV